MSTAGSIDAPHGPAGQPYLWVFCCGWCGRQETIDTRRYPPVTDERAGISTTCGWEVGLGLVICPDCCEHDEWSRL